MNNEKDTISEVAIKTVIARLEVLSPTLHFSSGVDGSSYSRDEMIKHVKDGDDVGLDFAAIELAFLRAQASGGLMQMLTSRS